MEGETSPKNLISSEQLLTEKEESTLIEAVEQEMGHEPQFLHRIGDMGYPLLVRGERNKIRNAMINVMKIGHGLKYELYTEGKEKDFVHVMAISCFLQRKFGISYCDFPYDDEWLSEFLFEGKNDLLSKYERSKMEWKPNYQFNEDNEKLDNSGVLARRKRVTEIIDPDLIKENALVNMLTSQGNMRGEYLCASPEYLREVINRFTTQKHSLVENMSNQSRNVTFQQFRNVTFG
ncbi:MAG: hypothetical protein CEN91_510 [Candidatus Berkelbacteria bacterium Licking1014_85]|uniref:Uncharacterized protein n=1 Tax=Candidatus Berkelbacteria bacterium Licking1014_85 TaxID=2017148 RepID=A0A554LHA3_9BACT|nr:MAG: hypothetical protein CEN91_510 [Candidatus Berkelbacteria bacterium Licking1014_85]